MRYKMTLYPWHFFNYEEPYLHVTVHSTMPPQEYWSVDETLMKRERITHLCLLLYVPHCTDTTLAQSLQRVTNAKASPQERPKDSHIAKDSSSYTATNNINRKHYVPAFPTFHKQSPEARLFATVQLFNNTNGISFNPDVHIPKFHLKKDNSDITSKNEMLHCHWHVQEMQRHCVARGYQEQLSTEIP